MVMPERAMASKSTIFRDCLEIPGARVDLFDQPGAKGVVESHFLVAELPQHGVGPLFDVPRRLRQRRAAPVRRELEAVVLVEGCGWR